MEMLSSPYIDLLKKMLCDYHRTGHPEYKPLYEDGRRGIKLLGWFDAILGIRNFGIAKKTENVAMMRLDGSDRPVHADTMIGMKRLDNIEYCLREVVRNNVPGDVMECGVWRGGAVILMRALLKEMNCVDRQVWVADSFEGLPAPDKKMYPADKGDKHQAFRELAVSLEEVKHNFKKYDLLDEQVRFLKGWFKDTLPSASVERLSVLRLDGDMYGSTMDCLVNLYPRLSKGGFLIIDDWGAIPACKQAVEDYRRKQQITEKIQPIDWTGVYWEKESE
jgi:O-methyltransferase